MILIAVGSPAYIADVKPVLAKGLTFSDDEVNTAISSRLVGIIWDDPGRSQLNTLLDGLTSTAFDEENLRKVLDFNPALEDWRVGEALAEAYLVDHRKCEFPWPSGRDLKNTSASPAGTDLVGFQRRNGGYRFAFGEVKTSPQEKWPPSLMKGRHGLATQLELLRDSPYVRNQLVVYLGHHAARSNWESSYKTATARYLKNPSDFSLFGILVRDVEPKGLDLSDRANALADKCPKDTSVELLALYLPKNSISELGNRVKQAKGRES